jgi:hypothetical protein
MGERKDGDVRKALERLGEGIRRLRLEVPELRKAAEMVFDDHWADVEADRRRSKFTVIPGCPDEPTDPSSP